MHPRCLAKFRATLVPNKSYGSDAPTISYRIECPGCGSGAFALVELLTGKSTTGLGLHCEQCKRELVIFDGLKHGWDGEFGNTTNLDIGGKPSFEQLFWLDGTRKRHDHIFAAFVYNIEKSEVEAESKKFNVKPVDLFDWFCIHEENPSWGEVMWEYECA